MPTLWLKTLCLLTYFCAGLPFPYELLSSHESEMLTCYRKSDTDIAVSRFKGYKMNHCYCHNWQKGYKLIDQTDWFLIT